MSLEILVTGIPEVSAMLQRVGNVTTGKITEMALKAGGMLIANEAKNNAPFISGTLRRSIHVGGYSGEFDDFDASEGYSDIGGNSPIQIKIGTNLVYAARIEYGFAKKDSLGRNYNQAAQSYLRKAMDSQKDDAIREVATVIRQELTKAVGR